MRLGLTLLMRNIYTNSSLDLLTIFRGSDKSTQIDGYVTKKHQKNHPNQDTNNQKLCNKGQHFFLSLTENQ